MDSLSPTKPKQTKQSFNILLHRALEEEQEQHTEHTGSRPVVSTPLSCPTDPLDKTSPWEPSFANIVAQAAAQPPPIVAPNGAVRVKYNRHKRPTVPPQHGTMEPSEPASGRSTTSVPNYDSMELHRKLLSGKLHAGNSLSETEADEMEDDLYHQTKKRTKVKKMKRVKMLGAVNLGTKFTIKTRNAE